MGHAYDMEFLGAVFGGSVVAAGVYIGLACITGSESQLLDAKIRGAMYGFAIGAAMFTGVRFALWCMWK